MGIGQNSQSIITRAQTSLHPKGPLRFKFTPLCPSKFLMAKRIVLMPQKSCLPVEKSSKVRSQNLHRVLAGPPKNMKLTFAILIELS
jgi:hypothetical protein